MSVYSITKESIVFQLGAWLCKHETALLNNAFGDHPSPVLQLWHFTESIHVVMSLYLIVSVLPLTRSQLCWDWVPDYVSMRLLSPHNFIWRPSVLQLCCSGTHRINTHSNVTVPDVSVFHHKESIVFQLGARAANSRTDGLQMHCCEESSLHAYIISTQLKHNWLLVMDTLTSGTVTLLCVLICEARAAQTGGRDGLQIWIVWGESSSCLHNQAPNLTQFELLIDEYTYIRYAGASSIATCIDSCECQSWRTGAMVSKCIVWGRAVSCYIIKHPIETQIDSLWWNTLTSGTVTLLCVLILWVPEQHNWRTDGLQMNCVRESSLMLT